MSIERIPLRKLLQLIYAEPRLRRRILLADIRDDERRRREEDTNGGDFYGPFWADVKDHVLGRLNLTEQTKARIANNGGRARLYPKLAEAFLKLWNEKVRWRNEPFEFFPENVKSQLAIEELDATIRIENTVAVKVWDGSERVIYPYFSEAPALSNEGARIAFWVLKEALPRFGIDDFRVVDVLRSGYLRTLETPLRGDERELLVHHYNSLLKEWRELQRQR